MACQSFFEKYPCITIHNGICGCTGICCKLGDYAFYFVGTDDQMSVEEYWQSYTKDMTVKMLHDVLKNQSAAEENGIEMYEWKYYCSILNQMYKVEKSEYRLVSLMDGTAMNDQTIIFKTNAPAEELKELERISCEVYLNGGDYEDVPIWETVLNDKGYVFEYMDSSTNCGSEFLEHTYAYVTEHYIIENQPDVKTAYEPKMKFVFDKDVYEIVRDAITDLCGIERNCFTAHNCIEVDQKEFDEIRDWLPEIQFNRIR